MNRPDSGRPTAVAPTKKSLTNTASSDHGESTRPGDVRQLRDVPEAVPQSASSGALITARSQIPDALKHKVRLVMGADGHAYAVWLDAPNGDAMRIGSRAFNRRVRAEYANIGRLLRSAELADITETLAACAEQSGERVFVWYRVAPIAGGVEIDLGDEKHTRVRITAGKVEIVASGSDTLFFRTSVCRPMVMPAEVGDLKLLERHLNVHATERFLLVAWIAYTLAHPKVPTSKYPILVLQGGQGSGKSSLANNVILRLIDPNSVGVQLLPSATRDLAIAAQHAHVLAYDNVRRFTADMSDVLCIASTGGATSSRQLYTDEDQHVLRLHVALVLNGIHPFVNQADLAQRCLPIRLQPMAESMRRSESEIVQAFEADLPAIQRGLFDRIAKILVHLPNVELTHPERMIDFVRWLAAMEIVDGVPRGVYQDQFSHVLHEGQLETLLDNVLADALLQFVAHEVHGQWSGTPAQLHTELSRIAGLSTTRSREWPQNPIAMSRRLRGLQASLLTQGVRVEMGRGKYRTITITNVGYRHE